jgi:hypothetical protein
MFRCQMRIAQRHCQRLVSEKFLDALDVHAGLRKPRRTSVSQYMRDDLQSKLPLEGK